MKAQFKVETTDNSTGKMAYRSYGNMNPAWFSIPTSAVNPAPPLPNNPTGGQPFESLLEWAEAVGRGITSLSQDSFHQVAVTATWESIEDGDE